MALKTCKKNSERPLCLWVRTCKKFNRIAKQQDYYEGSRLSNEEDEV
ncbi:hypothetical protein [Methanohalophilus sp.]